MGNRLTSGTWSPKRKKDQRKSTAAKSDAAAAVGGGDRGGGHAEAVSPVVQRGSVVAGVGGGTGGNADATDHDTLDTTTAATASSQWPRVAATLHAIDALAAPGKEASERQRQREEKRALDPALFFRGYGTNGGDLDSTNDDVALQYAHALLVAADADLKATDAALTLLRPIASRPVAAPLAADARVHLAQCLLLLDPTLRGSTSASEVETLLLECVRGDLDEELARQAVELLAHLRLARGDIQSALELFDREQPESMELAFQRACCRHLLRSEAVASDHCVQNPTTATPASYPAMVLQVDAAALLAGPR